LILPDLVDILDSYILFLSFQSKMKFTSFNAVSNKETHLPSLKESHRRQ